MVSPEEKHNSPQVVPPASAFDAGTRLPFPVVDIVRFAFGRLDEIDSNLVIFADARSSQSSIRAGEVRQAVKALASGLKTHGVKPGDCVCIHSFNSIWYPLLWLAIVATGGVVTGSNPAYTPNELTHHFKITDTKFIVAQAECIAAVKKAVLDYDISTSNIFVLGDDETTTPPSTFTPWKVLWQQDYDEDDNVCHTYHEAAQDDTIAVYAATSGTTGLPKAAELSHKYLVAQATILENLFSKRAGKITQLVCLPVFHAFAAQLSIVLPLRLGITTYFMPRFNLSEYLNYVPQFQITDAAIVPPIVSALTSAAASELDSLRYIICAGAPMMASVQSKLYSKLNPAATISQCWGATELGWVTVFDQTERDYTSSVGRVLPNTVLKVVDEDGNPVRGPIISGEALIKSPSMFKRYRNNPGISKEAFDQEGYYRTGDQVHIHNSKVFITGRIKDILKVNGWQVSPEEIEHVILELKGVTDCAVAGHTILNNKTGLEETKPRAFIVRKLDSDIDAGEIQNHVRERLVGYKRLTGGVVFVNAIPRSNTGKILRRKLVSNQIEKQELGHVCQDEASIAWAHYCVAMFLIPLCLAMGIPGMVLLCFGLRHVLRGGNRYT